MILLKWIFLFLILGVSSYIGILKSRTYEIRLDNLKKIQSSLNILKNKIEFTHEPINVIFKDISNIVYSDEENIFKLTNCASNKLYPSWINSIEKIDCNFNNEDKEILKTFGKQLGKTDIKGQINTIELTEKLIENQIEEAEVEKNKNTKLYKTLGIVFGIGICILLF